MQLRLTYILLFVVCFFCSACSTQISVGKTIKYNRNHSDHIFIGKEDIIWDTGAFFSVFFQDFASRKTWLCPMIAIDYNWQWTVNMMYYSPSMSFDSVTIKNMRYLLMHKNKAATFIKNWKIKGILGMNVISKANWLINCKDSTLQVMAQDEVYEPSAAPALTLSYRNRLVPKATLEVAGVTFNGVLIDSGFNADMFLKKEDIEQIHRHIVPVDTVASFSSSLYNDSIPERRYTYHNITINGHTFDTLKIVQSDVGRRIIGTGFFNKFSTVYLNTKERVFRFY